MKYSKPHLTFEEQLEKLVGRGLLVDYPQGAAHLLASIGYYRLSAYWYQWRIRPLGHNEATDTPLDEFVGGHSFEEAVDLYSFDRRLRLLLLDSIERLEVALRVRVAHVVGRHGGLAYLDRTYLGSGCEGRRHREGPTNYEWFKTRNHELLMDSSERFADHVKSKYDGEPPIWIAVELWDFGILTCFYQIMSLDDRIEVAASFNVPTYKMLTSWLLCLNIVRNICAHHGRLFRRVLVNNPGRKDMRRVTEMSHIYGLSDQRWEKLYPALAIMVYLMRTVAPGSNWSPTLADLVQGFPVIDGNSLADYGFPDDWKRLSLWAELLDSDVATVCS